MYVYEIFNKVNGKVYIGQTKKNVERRWNDHVWAANNGSKYFFYRALRKYGKDSFYISHIIKVQTQEEADFWEKEYISRYSSNCRAFGYNSTSGGRSVYHFNPESRKELKLHNKGVLGRSDVPTEKIVALHKLGVTCVEISKELGLGTMTVYRRLKKSGIVVRPHTVDFPVEAAVKMYEAGRTARCIGEMFGVSKYTVYRRLRGAGVAIKPSPIKSSNRATQRRTGGVERTT